MACAQTGAGAASAGAPELGLLCQLTPNAQVSGRAEDELKNTLGVQLHRIRPIGPDVWRLDVQCDSAPVCQAARERLVKSGLCAAVLEDRLRARPSPPSYPASAP
mgnify:CR=1 FL=1